MIASYEYPRLGELIVTAFSVTWTVFAILAFSELSSAAISARIGTFKSFFRHL
uniref:Uncharacterized protein n=1 Tax=Siphoviridae sp. ctmIh35 TaxID=2827932 RepID=A0A8S5T9E5_9CAUD|nr:MAG TPA: hypothetical protein [Siphoviridae sp. ctmIh35]